MSLLRKTQKPLLKQPSQQHQQPLSNRDLDDSDDIVVDDDIVFGRNRRAEEFGRLVYEDEPLSDYVMARLAQARELAMAAYRKAQT